MDYGGGSYSGSDVSDGMYSSSYGDYMSRGGDVAGRSYSSVYPGSGRGLGGSSYMGSSGSSGSSRNSSCNLSIISLRSLLVSFLNNLKLVLKTYQSKNLVVPSKIVQVIEDGKQERHLVATVGKFSVIWNFQQVKDGSHECYRNQVIYGDTDSIMIYSRLDAAKAKSISLKVIQEDRVYPVGQLWIRKASLMIHGMPE